MRVRTSEELGMLVKGVRQKAGLSQQDVAGLAKVQRTWLSRLELLCTYSTDSHDDVLRFCDALSYNWLVANTDAHAKNYSLLLAGNQVRLAPLYIVASVLPYLSDNPLDHGRPGQIDGRKLRVAMRVASTYELAKIRLRDWDILGESCGIDRYGSRVRAMCDAIAEEAGIVTDTDGAAIDSPIVDRWRTKIVNRARFVGKFLDGSVSVVRRRR
jgi:serine/threonine-protein kinase HipA